MQEWVSILDGGVFWRRGDSKQSRVLCCPRSARLRGIPWGCAACSPGLIAHLSPKWSDSLSNLPPRQPFECRADCCLVGRERGLGGS